MSMHYKPAHFVGGLEWIDSHGRVATVPAGLTVCDEMREAVSTDVYERQFTTCKRCKKCLEMADRSVSP